jgi:hypothetical protein
MSRVSAGLAALVLAAVAATAAPVAGAATCGVAGKPIFQLWGDDLLYTLATGGSMESAAGWSLAGGARVVAGNEPFYVNASTDAFSIELPAGSSARSPWTCLGEQSPVARLFAMARGSEGRLEVDVLYKDEDGRVRKLDEERFGPAAHARWAPTGNIDIEDALKQSGMLELDATAEIAFRFRAEEGKSTTWRIDDLHVDPWGEWLLG